MTLGRCWSCWGSPSTPRSTEDQGSHVLIRRLAEENPDWAPPRSTRLRHPRSLPPWFQRLRDRALGGENLEEKGDCGEPREAPEIDDGAIVDLQPPALGESLADRRLRLFGLSIAPDSAQVEGGRTADQVQRPAQALSRPRAPADERLESTRGICCWARGARRGQRAPEGRVVFAVPLRSVTGIGHPAASTWRRRRPR
jgi:hypothetical protein